METEREELVPDGPHIRLPQIDRGTWLWIGIAAGIAVVFLGLFLAHEFKLGGWPSIDESTLPASPAPLFVVLDVIEEWLPSLLVIGVAWVAFARRSGRERLLLILGVYLSGLELRPLISDALHSGNHVAGAIYRYPNTTAFYATIVFGGLVFAIDRSAMLDAPRRTFGIIAFAAMIGGWLFPIWAGYAQVPEVLGSIVLVGMLFALAVALARFAKIEIFARADDSDEGNVDTPAA